MFTEFCAKFVNNVGGIYVHFNIMQGQYIWESRHWIYGYVLNARYNLGLRIDTWIFDMAFIRQTVRRLNTGSHEVEKPRDWVIDILDIWHLSRQQHCWGTFKTQKNDKIETHISSLQHFAIR